MLELSIAIPVHFAMSLIIVIVGLHHPHAYIYYISVDVSQLQVAILTRSSREMRYYWYRLTVHPFTSALLSSAYIFFIREQHPKIIAKTGSRTSVC